MRRPARHTISAFDGDALQADVMRFMAIIGFCLIAIMALVRTAAPASEAPDAPLGEEPVAVSAPPPPVEIEPVAPVVVEAAPVAEKPARPEPVEPANPPQQIAAVEPAPQPPARLPAPPQTTLESASEPAAAEPWLALRFANDSALLRLIARGEVQVFAWRPGRILEVTRDLRFIEGRAPGEVYELLPSTVPAALQRALPGGDAAGTWTWGVQLPPRTVSAIGGWLSQVESGELVINRNGGVDHVAR